MKTSFPVSIIIEIIIVSIHCLSLNMIILLASTLARSLRDVWSIQQTIVHNKFTRMYKIYT